MKTRLMTLKDSIIAGYLYGDSCTITIHGDLLTEFQRVKAQELEIAGAIADENNSMSVYCLPDPYSDDTYIYKIECFEANTHGYYYYIKTTSLVAECDDYTVYTKFDVYRNKRRLKSMYVEGKFGGYNNIRFFDACK